MASRPAPRSMTNDAKLVGLIFGVLALAAIAVGIEVFFDRLARAARRLKFSKVDIDAMFGG